MRKLIAISILSVYLFSTTELNQLLKLPFLVKHFYEHKGQKSSLTLIEFLHMHYANGDVKDADYDKDMKLPFKSHDGCINTSITPFLHHFFTAEINRPVYIHTNNFTLHDEAGLDFFFLSNIWQPPRNC